jgi:hypothetical protein
MPCSNILIYGLLSIIIGIIANNIGKQTMDYYDISKNEMYKHVSIAIFSVGVVLVAFGIAVMFLRNNVHMCALLKENVMLS